MRTHVEIEDYLNAFPSIIAAQNKVITKNKIRPNPKAINIRIPRDFKLNLLPFLIFFSIKEEIIMERIKLICKIHIPSCILSGLKNILTIKTPQY